VLLVVGVFGTCHCDVLLGVLLPNAVLLDVAGLRPAIAGHGSAPTCIACVGVQHKPCCHYGDLPITCVLYGLWQQAPASGNV
jgi:hypothetical protein